MARTSVQPRQSVCCGIALCGGAASRLGGGNKALKLYAGKPLIEHTLGLLVLSAIKLSSVPIRITTKSDLMAIQSFQIVKKVFMVRCMVFMTPAKASRQINT